MRASLPSTRLTLALTALMACSPTEQERYEISIVTPRGVSDTFAGATQVTLTADATQLASVPISAGQQPFTLSTGNLDPILVQGKAAFRITATDETGKVVAYGEAPRVEVARSEPLSRIPLRIFVQRPGTLGRSEDSPFPIRRHTGATVESIPGSSILRQSERVSVPIFGTGLTLLPGQNDQGPVERPTDEMYLYSPFDHLVQGRFAIGNQPSTAQRSNSASIAFGNGRMMVFGGLNPVADVPEGRPSGQVDTFEVLRVNVVNFRLGVTKSVSTAPAGVPRESPALALVPAKTTPEVLAFGGRGENGQPLASIVRIDPTTPATALLDIAMAAPRVGLTATSLPGDKSYVLLFGGLPPGSTGIPTAELMETTDSGRALVALSVPTGLSNRRGHSALRLPGDETRVLILGGIDDQNLPVADAFVFNLSSKEFKHQPSMRLATPRVGAAIFIVQDDIVVAGGRDEAGDYVATAEIFSAKKLSPVAETACAPRAFAVALPFGERSVLLAGGEVDRIRNAAKDPMPQLSSTTVIEVYQPLR